MKTEIKKIIMSFIEDNINDFNKEDVMASLSTFLNELDHQLDLPNNQKRPKRKQAKRNKHPILEKCKRHSQVFQSFDGHKFQFCNTPVRGHIRRKWAGSTLCRNIRDQEGKPCLSLKIEVRPISDEHSYLRLTDSF